MSAGRAPGLVAWFLAAAVLGAGASVVVRWRAQSRPLDYAPPSAADPEQSILCFGGAELAPDGRRASYQLTPLFADVGRQAFEAEALRRRLNLAEGQPWRLVREWSGPGADVGRASSTVEVGDEHGAGVLSAIVAAEASGGPSDPVRTLLATPLGVQLGARDEWILWGRRPHGGVSLAIDGRKIALEDLRVRRADLEQPVAQLDAGSDGGKKSGLTPSEAPPGSATKTQR